MTSATTTYLSVDEFTARFAELAAQKDAATLQAAVDDANGLAFGYVGALYPTLDPVPQLLKGAVADLACRKLYETDSPDGVMAMYQEAMKTLREIASGVVQLAAAVVTDDDGESLVFSGSNVRRLCARQLGYWQPYDDLDDCK
ncbi:Mu-like prophage protein gp36 [Burkholderia sp. YR290]|nr:Mu-like prophage protein gp36 [Burkholderia sp. YR290]